MDLYIDHNGFKRSYSDLEAVNKISEARKKNDPWEVIDLLLDLWAKTAPDDVEAISINLEEYRAGLVDKEFGTTKGGKDMDRRFMLSIPKKLVLMIRTQFSAEELPMDKEFYRKFANRYPVFRVAEKD